MFNDLLNIIDYDTLKNKNFTFIESNNIDGSFLIHHLLSYCIKKDFKTLFLTLSQTLSHYKSIQVKLGNGVKFVKLMENNMITHVDCLKSTNGYLSTNDDDYFLNEIINQVTIQLNNAINYYYLIIYYLNI